MLTVFLVSAVCVGTAGAALTGSDITSQLTGKTGTITISLTDDVVISSSENTIKIGSGQDVTIVGNGKTISRGGEGFFLIEVADGGKLTLGNGESLLTVDGMGGVDGGDGNFNSKNNGYGLILVHGDNSQLVMNKGVTLTNSNVSKADRGTLFNDANNVQVFGTAVGAAVQVVRGAEFVMEGGDIVHNKVHSLGAVFVRHGEACIILKNGNISNNEAVNGECGGLFIADTDASKMYGGNISYNVATNNAGLYVTRGCFEMTAGDIHHNEATESGAGVAFGGLDENDIFHMRGGDIYSNVATKSGGGIHICYGGKFIMYNNANISNNTAKENGGGVWISYSGSILEPSQFIMHDNTRIANNTAEYGGGAYIAGHSGKVIFSMDGGIIKDNSAPNGGGICLVSVKPTDGESSAGLGLTGLGMLHLAGTSLIHENNEIYQKYKEENQETLIVLVDDRWEGSAKNITGDSGIIKNGYVIVQIKDGLNTQASQVLDKFALRSTHTTLALTSSSDYAKRIIITDMPVVNASTVKTTAYNSTTANVTFALQTHSGATGYYVNLTNGTDVFYNYTTVSIDAGGGVRDVQVEGLTGGKIYTLTITPLKDDGTPNVYTHPTKYTAPEVYSVTLEDGTESKVLDINGESSGTLSTVVKDKDGNVLKEILQWESGDTDILSFDENGEYTLHKKGDITITVNVSSKEEVKDTIKISVIDTTPIEPNLPITEPTKDNDGNTTITGTVTVKDEHTAEIEGDGVTIIVEFKEGTGLTQGQPVKGNVTNVLASYDEASASTGETVNGVVNYQLNLTLKNVTTYLPKINATLNTTIKNAVEDLGFKTVSMITAESNITEINKNLTTGSVEIVFTVPTSWYDSVDIFSFHYKDTQLVGTPQPIPTSNIERGTTTTKITLYVDEFSTHGIAGKPKTVTPPADDNSASSSSQGSSVWLMETQTPTPTPTATPTQTDTVPTDIPSTKPTETPDSPAPILGILASLGFCVAAMRRR